MIKSPINSSDEVRVDNNIVDRDELWVYDLNDKGTMARNNSISEIVLDDLYFLDEELLARLDELNQSLIDTDEKVASGDLIFDGTGYYSALLYEDYSVQSAKNSFSPDISWYKLPIQINTLVRISKFRWAWRTVTIGYLPIPVLKGYNIQLQRHGMIAIGTLSMIANAVASKGVFERDGWYFAMKEVTEDLENGLGVIAKIAKYKSQSDVALKFVSAMRVGDEYSQKNQLKNEYPNLSDYEIGDLHSILKLSQTYNGIGIDVAYNLMNIAASDAIRTTITAINYIITTADIVQKAVIVGDVTISVVSGTMTAGVTIIVKAVIAALGAYIYNTIGKKAFLDGVNCELSNHNNIVTDIFSFALEDNGAAKINKSNTSNCFGVKYKINTALWVKERYYVY